MQGFLTGLLQARETRGWGLLKGSVSLGMQLGVCLIPAPLPFTLCFADSLTQALLPSLHIGCLGVQTQTRSRSAELLWAEPSAATR